MSTAHTWLTEKMKVPGVIACGLRWPDERTFTRTGSATFSPALVENACRSLANTFRIFLARRLPAKRVRWVYDHYHFYGAIRPDGVCFALLTSSSAPHVQPPDFEKLAAEFENLNA